MNQILVIVLVIINILINDCACQMHWEKLFDSLSYKLSSKPAPRREAAIGHDREKNRIVIFGGWQTNNENTDTFTKYTMPVLFDDTWEYNLETKIWRPLSFSLIRPQARYGMLYTHNKHGLYVSCGRGWLDEYFNDLWIYDFSDDQWRKMDQTFISIMPEPRYATVGGIYPSYEYSSDEKHNLYLAMGRSQYDMYNNMYAFTFTDLRAVSGIWEMIYTDILTGPYSFTSPHGRTFASSAVISPDELLIHGGCLSGGFSGGPCPSFDSWIFSYSKNKWEKIDSSCISPRIFSSMASLVSDGFRQSAVMFSGYEKDSTMLKTDYEREEEVALYDSLARKWVKKRVQGFYFPEKRNGHVMCTGKLNNDYGVFMFGGYGHFSGTNLADLWFLRVNISSAFDNPTLTSFYPIGDTNDKYFFNLCCSYFTTIHVHAILMFIGWGIFINIGTLIVNYADKDKDDDNYEKRHRMVVRTYNVLQFFGLLFITGGIVFGIWSAHGIPHLAHALIGISAYLLAIIKPISSYLKKQTKKFDYYLDEEEKLKAEEYKSTWCYSFLKIIHKNLSRTAILLAIINISLGVFLAVFEWYWILIWFIYLGLFICIYMMFEAKRQSKNKSTSNEDDNDKLNNNSSISTSKNDLTKSNLSLNKLDDYEDGYEMNISKSDSTQHLRPVINDNPNPSNRTVENLKMDPIRYTPSSQLMAKNNIGGGAAATTTKHSPITPPPPYFNRNKNSISTIELDSYTIKTSSPNQSISRKTPSQAHLLSYSQQTNLNDLNDEIDNELPLEQNHQQHTSFSNLSRNNNNNNNGNRPSAVTPTPRKIYQTINNNNNNNINNQAPFYTVAQHTKTTLLNDNNLNNNNSSFRMNNQHPPVHQQQHQQSFRSNSNSQHNSIRQNSNYSQHRSILSNQNVINHINSNILNPINNPNNYRY